MFTQRSRHHMLQRMFWNPVGSAIVHRLVRYERQFDTVVRNYSLMTATNGERWLSTLMDEEPVVFDVGFHDGTSSDEIFKLRPKAKVYGFDPSRFGLKSYEERFKDDPRVVFANVALSHEPGELEFFDYDNMCNSLAARKELPDMNATKYTVPVTTLDAYCQETGVEHINMMKIDAEGYDLNVLEGGRDMLAREGVDIFMFEFASGWANTKRYLWEAVDYMEPLPYKLFHLFNGFLCPLGVRHPHRQLHDTFGDVRGRQRQAHGTRRHSNAQLPVLRAPKRPSQRMLDHAVMGLCTRLPRGGFALAKAARRILPGLAHYPARLRFAPFELRGDVSQNIFYPLATHGYYTHQAVEDDLLVFLAREARAIADVGANIGYTAALMASFVPPGTKIRAYEPLPLCTPYLEQVTARFPDVEFIAKAVGEAPGKAEFAQRPSIDRSSLAGKGDSPVTQMISVDVTTLDADYDQQPVDFIKIDVEGFEPAVLKGGRETIRRNAPVVVFEAYEQDVLEFAVEYFRSIGTNYEILVVNSAGTLRSLGSDAPTTPDTCNYVAWPSERGKPIETIPKCYER